MAETSMAGQTAALAALLAAGTFLLYFLKHLLDAVRAWHDEQRRAERLICALYAEIDANLHDLQGFLDESAGLERGLGETAERVAGQFGRVGHSLVYETHLTELASLPRAVIYKVVSFYSHQERLGAALDRLDALGDAPAERRIAALQHARRIAGDGVRFGRDVLHGLEVNAPLDLVKAALKGPQPQPA